MQWLPRRETLSVAISRRWWLETFQTSLYANSAYLIANFTTGAVLTFVFWIVAARLYPAEALGLAAALTAAGTFLAFVASLGLGAGLIRFLPGGGDGRIPLINSVYTIAGVSGVAAAFVFLGGLPLWSPALDFVLDDPVFVATFVVTIVAATLFILLDDTFVGLRRAEFALLQNSVVGVLKLVLVIAIAATSIQVLGIFASWGLAVITAVGLNLFLFLPRPLPGYRPMPTFRRQISGEMMRFSLANYARSGLWAAPLWLLPLMVVNRLGGEANAYFFLAWGMAALLYSIPTATTMALLAEGSHQEESLPRDVARSFKFIALLLLPTIVALLLAADKLLLIFGPEYSAEGSKVVRMLAPSALPLAVNAVYLAIAMVHKRLKRLIAVPAAIATGTLVLSYALIPYQGILGPAIGWLASHTAVAIILLPSIVRVLRSRPAVAPVTEL